MAKMMDAIKKWWFVAAAAVLIFTVFTIAGNYGKEINAYKCQVESDRPGCYIFYGIAQNDLRVDGGDNRIKVRYLIEGFPPRDHDVFVELIYPDGSIDFLYSQKHSGNHKAHHSKSHAQREYHTSYKIPIKHLHKGVYKLRITFKFHMQVGEKRLVSNDMKFQIK